LEVLGENQIGSPDRKRDDASGCGAPSLFRGREGVKADTLKPGYQVTILGHPSDGWKWNHAINQLPVDASANSPVHSID